LCRYLQKLCQVFLSPFDGPFHAVGAAGTPGAASFGRGRQSFAGVLPLWLSVKAGLVFA
jgi:hypothetical protein